VNREREQKQEQAGCGESGEPGRQDGRRQRERRGRVAERWGAEALLERKGRGGARRRRRLQHAILVQLLGSALAKVAASFQCCMSLEIVLVFGSHCTRENVGLWLQERRRPGRAGPR
jgi:hypothetical protein